MQTETRQAMGCGYEPATAGAQSWAPASWADRGLSTTACPGYTTSLPAVLEIVEAYPQWERGTLTEALDGEPPTANALTHLMVFQAGLREHEADMMRAAQKRGT